MTVLFVGDVHLKSARVLPAVDRAVAMTGAVGVVFLGDVCDDWDATARQAVAAVRMFADWVRARRAAGLDVTVLTGNHDLPYLARPNTTGSAARRTASSRAPTRASTTRSRGWMRGWRGGAAASSPHMRA